MAEAGPSPARPRRTVLLAGEVDFDGFRQTARALLTEDAAPDEVEWAVADAASPGLFEDSGEASPERLDSGNGALLDAPSVTLPAPASPRVPAAFIELCRSVVLHRDPTRFARLYRLLWRLQREPALRHDTLDPEMAEARLMAQAVRREMHKMKAFVRFREVRPESEGPPLHVAWFEPEHHVVEAVAPFFMRRFAGMAWAILTPERCVRWDGKRLLLSPGASRQDAPAADAGESLWLTYYASIFNPARLKLRAMEKEMPRRYWVNLPEATLISGLAASAHERSDRMVEQAPTVPARRIPQMLAPAREPGAQAGASRLSMQSQRDAAASCRECPLGALATQTVWGEGPPGATLMLVGEQPGDQEDLQGRPFVGPAGQLLMRGLQQLGWPRDAVYITNAVKHFKYEPRGKRRIHKTPAQREADACLHWLEGEIELVAPMAIVALGATAARQLLGRPVAVTRERGQWLQRADGRQVLITLHPSALLRMEPADRDAAYAAWLRDLQAAAPFVSPVGDRENSGNDVGGDR